MCVIIKSIQGVVYMTHAQIISLLGEADSSADTAGRAFFAPQTSSEDRKRVLEFLTGAWI